MLGAKPHLSWDSTSQVLEQSCDSRESLCDVTLGSTLGDETGKRRKLGFSSSLFRAYLALDCMKYQFGTILSRIHVLARCWTGLGPD